QKSGKSTEDSKKKKAPPSSGGGVSPGATPVAAPGPVFPPQAPPPSAAAKPAAVSIKAGENKIVDAYDPNYQTLAVVGAGAFDKPSAPPPAAAAAAPPPAAEPKKDLPKAGENKIADSYDPNYQTLVAVGGGDAFGADKKK
ncbi:hypothetical protein PMAYCL1PPCAC_14747, partial [Pristionchus mayeri]